MRLDARTTLKGAARHSVVGLLPAELLDARRVKMIGMPNRSRLDECGPRSKSDRRPGEVGRVAGRTEHHTEGVLGLVVGSPGNESKRPRSSATSLGSGTNGPSCRRLVARLCWSAG